MKKLITIIALMICSMSFFAQSGTIYTNRKIIESNKIKINQDNIEYQIPYTYDTNYTTSKYIDINLIDSIIYKNQVNYYSKKCFSDMNDYELYNIRYNLNKMYREYSVGTSFIIAGVSTSLIGSVVMFTSFNQYSYIIMAVGGTSTLIGYIIQVDSHKYLKKASIQYQLSPVNAKVKITF
jgi:hypothetical protein